MISTARQLSPAKLLVELAIELPEDIDIEAIAYFCGATVLYDDLHGSAARIIGVGDRATITVDRGSPRGRQRFSAAHELGHWMIDRGKLASFVCTEKDLIGNWGSDNPERRANRFAVDLLMPESLFKPEARGREITFATVLDLCGRFQTSLTATGIRLVEYGSFPSMVVYLTSDGIRWSVRDRDVPDAIQLRDRPGRHSNAAELLLGGQHCKSPAEVEASDWFTHPRSKYFSIIEDSVEIYPGTVLSLLWWKDEGQLLELEAD